MKIKQRLRISFTGSAITVFIVILILSVTMFNVKSAFEEKKIADEIIRGSLERSILASDYLATDNVMSKKQWLVVGDHIGKILKLASEEFKDKQDKIIVKALLENHESSGNLFLKIEEAREKASSDPRHTVLYHHDAAKLSSQLATKRYATMEYASNLQRAGNQYLLSTLQIAGWSILFVIIVVTATIIINLWSMGRTITHRINHLSNSAIVIGQGDLDHRIQINGDDELTEFAHVFNTMTEKLHKSYLDIENEISERKLAEEKLKQANEHLEAVNKELDAFSYSVAHDLRAPLVHMSGFAGLLQKKLSEHQDEKIRTYAAAIVSAAKRMGMLIDDLLAFSHIERSAMHKEEIGLKSLVMDVAQEIQSETRGQDILWQVDELPQVHGDQSLLRLVLVNLLSNSVKYTRTRPRSEITVGYKDEELELIFFVKDNGVGFDMKCVDKLFGVFQRLHTQDEFEGTGIGLASVRRIISRHGGRTWAEGAVGKGATFYFTLPKAKEI